MSYYDETTDPTHLSMSNNQDALGRSYQLSDLTLAKLENKLDEQRGNSVINLSDAFIGDEGCEVLSRYLYENHLNINSIDLRGNNITEVGLQALIPALRKLTALRNLSLEWNGLRSGTAPLVDAFSYSTALKNLDLRNNRIDWEGVENIARLIETNKSLVSIDLRWNEIGSKGALSLIGALKRPHSISVLQLSGNNIPDDLQQQIDSLLKNGEPYQQEVTYNSRVSPRQTSENFYLRPSSDGYNNARTSPRNNASPLRNSPRNQQVPQRDSPRRQDPLVPASLLQKEKEYNDELQQKYEAQLQSNNRTEQRLIELGQLMEQENYKHNEYRNELLRELEGEKMQRIRSEEQLMVSKEENLKFEMETERTIQDLQYQISRLKGEKAQLIEEVSSAQDNADKISYQSQEKIRQLEDRLGQSQRLYNQLEESSRSSYEKLRRENEEVLRDVRRDLNYKIEVLEDNNRQYQTANEQLDLEVQQLRNQNAQLKAYHLEQLVDTENKVREEESAKFNSILKGLEQRMKAIEEARENLSKKNQDLQRDLAYTEQRYSDQVNNLEVQLAQIKDDKNELQRTLHNKSNQADDLGHRLKQTEDQLTRSEQEVQDLVDTLNQRKEAHIQQIDKLNTEYAAERKRLEGIREDLSQQLYDTEQKYANMASDRDRILREYDRLCEDLKARVVDAIGSVVYQHVKRIDTGPRDDNLRRQ